MSSLTSTLPQKVVSVADVSVVSHKLEAVLRSKKRLDRVGLVGAQDRVLVSSKGTSSGRQAVVSHESKIGERGNGERGVIAGFASGRESVEAESVE